LQQQHTPAGPAKAKAKTSAGKRAQGASPVSAKAL
jgi:hypothetical protein